MDSSLIEQSTIENNSLVEKNCVIKHYSIISSSKIGQNAFQMAKVDYILAEKELRSIIKSH